jgi:hypothetical protein
LLQKSQWRKLIVTVVIITFVAWTNIVALANIVNPAVLPSNMIEDKIATNCCGRSQNLIINDVADISDCDGGCQGCTSCVGTTECPP